LAFLYLSYNHINGSTPLEIWNLANLEAILDLSSNNISGSIHSRGGSLTSLRYLDLSSNQINGSILYEIGNMENLKTLDLSSNNIHGSVPTIYDVQFESFMDPVCTSVACFLFTRSWKREACLVPWEMMLKLWNCGWKHCSRIILPASLLQSINCSSRHIKQYYSVEFRIQVFCCWSCVWLDFSILIRPTIPYLLVPMDTLPHVKLFLLIEIDGKASGRYPFIICSGYLM